MHRDGRLTNGQIHRLSYTIGVDWDSLAGLLDIPYSQREEIRTNHVKYPDCTKKALQMFSLYNNREDFNFCNLQKCVHEIERLDLIDDLRSVENQVYPMC